MLGQNRRRHWRYWHDNRWPLLSLRIGSLLHEIDMRRPDAIPDLGQCQTLYVVSDYGGSHQGQLYRTYSFMVVDASDRERWAEVRSLIRDNLTGLGMRTMSYKDIARDRVGQEALLPFIRAAQKFRGLTFTLAVHRDVSVDYLLRAAMASRQCFANFGHWDRPTIQRFRIVTHILALLTRGLAREGQQVVWITDNDSIVQKPEAEVNSFGTCVMQKYVKWPLDFGWLTTSQVVNHRDGTSTVTKNLEAEDYAAIPDLIAGAISDWLTYSSHELVTPAGELILPEMPERVGWRVQSVLSELSAAGNLLRHIYGQIFMDDGHTQFRIIELNEELRRSTPPIQGSITIVPESLHRFVDPPDSSRDERTAP
jgi:hypothetical protein